MNDSIRMTRKFNLPTKIVFGSGSAAALGEETAKLGRKALLVTGRNSLQKNGILDRIRRILAGSGISSGVFDGVIPEPGTGIVDSGILAAVEGKYDVIIGLGGGSAIDAAKAVAGLAPALKKGEKSCEYLEIDGTRRLSSPGLPFISVPTVAGTGAEITNNAVLASPSTGSKRSLRNEHLFARTAVLDPELTAGVPREISNASGADCLCHLLEGYFSPGANSVTDMFAVTGMRYVLKHLPELNRGGFSETAGTAMMLASLYGGIIISNAGLGLIHGIASVIGPGYGIAHGIACAMFLPETAEYNFPALDAEKRKTVEELFGREFKENLKRFLSGLGLDEGAGKHGISPEDIPELAVKILNTSSAKKNPRPVSEGDLANLLKKMI